jgi:VanZ family protein
MGEFSPLNSVCTKGDAVTMAGDRGMMTHRPRHLWLPVMAWAALIAIATSTPGQNLPPSPLPHFDLAVHFGIYGVLAFLLYRALHYGTRLGTLGWAWLVAFALTQSYGILDEIHQLWIPNRSCTFGDALADGIGAVLGVWVFFFWVVRRARPVNLSATDSRP